MSYFESVLKKSFKARELTRAEAPHLVNALEELSAKAGVKAPRLHLIDTNIFAVPFGGALGRDHIVINDKLLHALDSTVSGVPTQEMQAVLAHELSHVKHSLRDIGLPRASFLLAPVAAVAGYYLYERSHKKMQEKGGNLHDHLVQSAQQEHAAIGQATLDPSIPDHDAFKGTMHDLVTIGKYAAVAVAGTAAGALAARQFSRSFEFAADRHAAKLVNAEAMGNALKKMHGKFEEVLSTLDMSKQPGLMKLMNATFGAHPSMEERLANLSR